MINSVIFDALLATIVPTTKTCAVTEAKTHNVQDVATAQGRPATYGIRNEVDDLDVGNEYPRQRPTTTCDLPKTVSSDSPSAQSPRRY